MPATDTDGPLDVVGGGGNGIAGGINEACGCK